MKTIKISKIDHQKNAKLQDLCVEDRARVGELIKRLAEEKEEKDQIERIYLEQQREYQGNIKKLQVEQDQMIKEQSELQEKFSESLSMLKEFKETRIANQATEKQLANEQKSVNQQQNTTPLKQSSQEKENQRELLTVSPGQTELLLKSILQQNNEEGEDKDNFPTFKENIEQPLNNISKLKNEMEDLTSNLRVTIKICNMQFSPRNSPSQSQEKKQNSPFPKQKKSNSPLPQVAQQKTVKLNSKNQIPKIPKQKIKKETKKISKSPLFRDREPKQQFLKKQENNVKQCTSQSPEPTKEELLNKINQSLSQKKEELKRSSNKKQQKNIESNSETSDDSESETQLAQRWLEFRKSKLHQLSEINKELSSKKKEKQKMNNRKFSKDKKKFKEDIDPNQVKQPIQIQQKKYPNQVQQPVQIQSKKQILFSGKQIDLDKINEQEAFELKQILQKKLGSFKKPQNNNDNDDDDELNQFQISNSRSQRKNGNEDREQRLTIEKLVPQENNFYTFNNQNPNQNEKEKYPDTDFSQLSTPLPQKMPERVQADTSNFVVNERLDQKMQQFLQIKNRVLQQTTNQQSNPTIDPLTKQYLQLKEEKIKQGNPKEKQQQLNSKHDQNQEEEYDEVLEAFLIEQRQNNHSISKNLMSTNKGNTFDVAKKQNVSNQKSRSSKNQDNGWFYDNSMFEIIDDLEAQELSSSQIKHNQQNFNAYNSFKKANCSKLFENSFK